MSPVRSPLFLADLVRELCKLAAETEWLELKRNDDQPEELGPYISALSNTAALVGKAHAYLVWGVDDESHQIVGTTVDPRSAKKGNENLENWLLQKLTPKLEFWFHEVEVEGKRVVLLEIERAARQPVQFEGVEYLRVGSYKKKLKDYPDKERALWRLFDQIPFEVGLADENLPDEQVLHVLDHPAYFELMSRPLPPERKQILDALAEDHLIRRNPAGQWDVTNLGAILFAKKLAWFQGLARKAVRVIVYQGTDRTETERETLGERGYAVGFDNLLKVVNLLIPSHEVVEQALRKTVPMYPPLAVRELVANALIHQDFSIRGAGPTVEIFSDRLEVTNPGSPLIQAERFLDLPPRSRNETLASLMRRMGICEERGSGIDKVVKQTELFQLPAPLFEVKGDSMRAVLFAHRSLEKMSRDDRIRACYLHACLKYVSHDFMTNLSLRERFGLEEQKASTISRYIREAIDAKVIAAVDPGAGRKFMKYVPGWAAPGAVARPA
jgi:predicted HTH transcriptional regulator